MALEALAEYDLMRSNSPAANLLAEFTVPGRSDIATLALANREKAEIGLKVQYRKAFHQYTQILSRCLTSF